MSDADNGLPFEPWDWEEDDETPLNDLHTPEGASDFIREAVRQDLAPRTNALVSAPLRDDVDGGRALAGFLLRAAETGENAESCLGRLGDLEDLTEDEQEILARTRDLLFAAAAWTYFDDDRARLADVVDDLERAVDVISAAADVGDQLDVDVPELEQAVEDTTRVKHAQKAEALVEGPLVNSLIECDDSNGLSAEVRLLDVVRGTVGVSASIDGKAEGAEVHHSICAHLSPAQAEALAGSLVEWADAAREYQEDDDA
jgi:hypothetical protein